jgi:lysophospholipase L1-like esterase
MRRIFSLVPALLLSLGAFAQQPETEAPPADRADYLLAVSRLCQVDWPKNRAVNIVCHGHSVPAGYFKTPEVRSLESYPHLVRAELAKRFPHAVINVIVTAIGGENAERGAARFKAEVLNHRPDVVTIDYALNDRGLGLERAQKAWVAMIQQAKAAGVKVLLLTPTPDLAAKLDDPADPLNQHAEQIRQLAREHNVGLVDSLAAFQQFTKDGGDLRKVMSQGNHPNAQGHDLVKQALVGWFP